MKAYVVGLESNPDAGNEIVFAKNSKEAKKIAHTIELTDNKESYIDVYVKRNPTFDDMENLPQKVVDKVKWREGWRFFQEGCPNCETATDEEFYAWYDRVWRKEHG